MELADWHMWWKRRGAAGVRRILLEVWDPIGVADAPEAQDEYDTYVGPIGRMLREHASCEELHVHLARISTDDMGLGPSARGTDAGAAAAGALVEWYAEEIRLTQGTTT